MVPFDGPAGEGEHQEGVWQGVHPQSHLLQVPSPPVLLRQLLRAPTWSEFWAAFQGPRLNWDRAPPTTTVLVVGNHG